LPSEIYRVSSAPIDAEKLRLGMKVQRGKKLFQKRTKTKKSNLPHPKLIDHGAHISTPRHHTSQNITNPIRRKMIINLVSASPKSNFGLCQYTQHQLSDTIGVIS
jgi:hypothetical protein